MHKKVAIAVCVTNFIFLSACLKASAQTSSVSEANYSKEPYVIEQALTKLVFQNDGKYTQESKARAHTIPSKSAGLWSPSFSVCFSYLNIGRRPCASHKAG
jgi:hypothetical protein